MRWRRSTGTWPPAAGGRTSGLPRVMAGAVWRDQVLGRSAGRLFSALIETKWAASRCFLSAAVAARPRAAGRGRRCPQNLGPAAHPWALSGHACLTPSVPRLSFRYLFRREDRALLIQHPATGRYLARRALPRRWCAWRWPHRRFAAGLCRGALCKPRRMPRP